MASQSAVVWGVLRTAPDRLDRSVNLTAVIVPEAAQQTPETARRGPYGSQRQYVVSMDAQIAPAGTRMRVRLILWRGNCCDWTGEPAGALRLQPFLGAPAHVVLLADDGSTWMHEHASDSAAAAADEASQHPCHSPLSFSTTIDVWLTLPRPGVYRLVGQSAHALDVIFYSFFVEAVV